MATAGSCLHDPVSGIAGDIYNAWTAATDSGFDARATTDGETARGRLAACIDAIAASIAGNVSIAVQAKSASFTAAGGVYYRCNATGGNIVATIPAGSGVPVGTLLYVKKVDASANLVTLQRTGGDTIDGSTTYVLSAQWQAVTLLATTTGWDVIAKV